VETGRSSGNEDPRRSFSRWRGTFLKLQPEPRCCPHDLATSSPGVAAFLIARRPRFLDGCEGSRAATVPPSNCAAGNTPGVGCLEPVQAGRSINAPVPVSKSFLLLRPSGSLCPRLSGLDDPVTGYFLEDAPPVVRDASGGYAGARPADDDHWHAEDLMRYVQPDRNPTTKRTIRIELFVSEKPIRHRTFGRQREDRWHSLSN
jgi:hypothetical protein